MLQKLLIQELQVLLHAESQLIKALPKMVRAAKDAQLTIAFEKHYQETQAQMDRLKEVFELFHVRPKTKVCKGMRGLLKETDEAILAGEKHQPDIADLALIIAAQKIQHYEWSGYGSVRTIAQLTGHSEAARLLGQNEAEEERADKTLTRIGAPILRRVVRVTDDVPANSG